MPRIKLDGEKKNENRRILLEKLFADRKTKKQFFGKMIGGGQQLGYHRFNKPTDLTIEEVDIMKLTDRQIVCLVRGLEYKEEPEQ